MGLTHKGAPKRIILELRRLLKATTLIETGTYRGETAEWAAGEFEQVVTIEAATACWELAQVRLAGIHNIQSIHGHSACELPNAISQLIGPVIFWLDAHWSGDITHGVSDECPLLAELDAISACTVPHAVLIDDARYFAAPPPTPHVAAAWPDLMQVCASLAGRYVTVFEDVIIAVPNAQRAPWQSWLQLETTNAWRKVIARRRRWARWFSGGSV